LTFAGDAYFHEGGIDIGDLETDELEGAETQKAAMAADFISASSIPSTSL
jgi:hypothetical protein